MRIVKLSKESKENLLADLLKRDPNNYGQYADTVQAIVDDVKARGDEALFEYTEKFDKVKVTKDTIRVTKEEIDEALKQVDPKLMEVMVKSMKNIRAFHEKQKQLSWFDTTPDGTILGQRVTPLDSAGLYVPGGKAAYPSSVLMNIIPAEVAGVNRIVMVTPPGKDGKVNPVTLAAAHIAGATEVYACATHAVFSEPAVDRLKESPFSEVIVTDSIELPEDKKFDKLTILSTSKMFAEIIKRIYSNEAISDLFELPYDEDDIL